MIKRPPARPRIRGKRSYRRAKATPRLDLSVSLVTPPVTATVWTHFPGPPNPAPAQPPVTLTVGDPPVIRVDLVAFFADAVQFVTEHPMVCTAIAAGIIFVICACNQPTRPSYA
jgi:hypothetical protein